MAVFHSHSATLTVLTPTYLAASSATWFTRDDYLFQRQHVQTLQLRTSLWLKRHQYSHTVIHYRSGQHGKKLYVRYLPDDKCYQARDWYTQL